MISLSNDLARKCKIEFDRDDSHEDRCIKILYFQEMCELIDKLGWHEHTSDWDPWIQVEFEDSDSVVTEENMTGYIDFDWIDKNGNEITVGRDVKDGIITICCDQEMIRGIRLWIDFDDKEEMPIKSGVIYIDSLLSMTWCD